MDINNFVIDRVVRGVMVNKAGEYQWSINQITDPSLSVTTEDSRQAVDALGAVIAEFDNGKSAEFSGENSLFDLGLYAAQMGTEKDIASSTNKIVTPAFETIKVVTGTSSYTLAHAPKEALTQIYLLSGDGTLSTAYAVGTAASATEFAYDAETHAITIPTGLTGGEELFVMYEYETEDAVQVVADGVNFPKKGKFIMEILGSDVCDQETLIHAYLVFPNAKLSSDVDITFTTDGTHPFTIQAMQDYCDSEKKLFSLIIPNEE